jgi:hypothetical protein
MPKLFIDEFVGISNRLETLPFAFAIREADGRRLPHRRAAGRKGDNIVNISAALEGVDLSRTADAGWLADAAVSSKGWR